MVAATKHQRKVLLDEFAWKYRDAHLFETAVDLNDDLGSSAGLYLSRIQSWLRRNCADGAGLAQHIHAMAVFLRGPILQEFIDVRMQSPSSIFGKPLMQMEGVPLLLYVLSFPPQAVSDADCAAVIHLLQTSGRCGRAFKEYISHCGGERSVVQCCLARSPQVSCESVLWLTSLAMLLEQCCGNPNSTQATFAALHLLFDSDHVNMIRMASQIVRELVATTSPHYDARVAERIWDLVPTAMTLLTHESCKVQFEALELVYVLVQNSPKHFQREYSRGAAQVIVKIPTRSHVGGILGVQNILIQQVLSNSTSESRQIIPANDLFDSHKMHLHNIYTW
ncbi:hypothetical protein H310_12515 [Aphanomyces invadans]|uniref:Uncharacterized protein n=1 Tax=Aphanomyces invadans TaxID=157072 RepID=A0A024THL4_9STRA|nr:hypothetical protein H310_12515 [Aphanomyces invadans]ETV93464.1 hypothetical protein H310_12515 [Aphanomyces invadans]|eukprot:XP_008877806.1 hypothetical protein H310_12515 [Aphanomyces invadans]